MKLWTLSTFAVLAFLTYSVAQYCRESATLHQKALATEGIASPLQDSKPRKPLDQACLSSELAIRKHLIEEPHPSTPSIALTAALR